MAVATKRDFVINYGLQTDNTGSSTGNTLFVDQVNDRVGVGTSPTYKFHVERGSAGDYAYMGGSSDSSRGLKFSSADDGVYLGAAHTIEIMSAGGSLLFKDNDTNWLKLNRNGNVGVNNTNPAYNLDVTGDINFTGTLYKEGEEYVASRWTLTGSDIYRISKVGINESNPQSQLAVKGYITESTDDGTNYWNVVTQQDIGSDPNQIPLNQYLGQLAFLDNITPVKISETAPSTNVLEGNLWWDKVGGRLYVYYNDGTTSNWVDASPFGTPSDLVLDGTLTVRTKAMIGNDSSATNLEIKVTSTQATNANKAFTINNNDSISGLDISYRGEILPKADADVNLGGPSNRWANIYSADLQLSNEGSHNDVDGTWGKYTIQEGENDLFLINRRSGKKYKFVLEEV